MRFKIDENLPYEIADDLQSLGHDADSVVNEGLAGCSDDVVVEHARVSHRILLTLDKGIASLLRYPSEAHHGVVLFRPGSSGRGSVLAFVREHLPVLLALHLGGRVSVVTRTGIRMR
jgi:predicted nuclease of predicted toxin-antitoxin system